MSSQPKPALPSARELRWFSVGQAVAITAMAWMLRRHIGSPLAGVLFAAALGFAVVGCLAPHAVQWFYVSGKRITYPARWLIFRVLLATVYYGVVTPVGLLLRWSGRDSLSRRPKTTRSYWVRREAPPEVSRYFKQF